MDTMVSGRLCKPSPSYASLALSRLLAEHPVVPHDKHKQAQQDNFAVAPSQLGQR